MNKSMLLIFAFLLLCGIVLYSHFKFDGEGVEADGSVVQTKKQAVAPVVQPVVIKDDGDAQQFRQEMVNSINNLNQMVGKLSTRLEQLETSLANNQVRQQDPSTTAEAEPPAAQASQSVEDLYTEFEGKIQQGENDADTANRMEILFSGNIKPQVSSVQCNHKLCKVHSFAPSESDAEASLSDIMKLIPWQAKMSYFIKKSESGAELTFFFTKENVSEL